MSVCLKYLVLFAFVALGAPACAQHGPPPSASGFVVDAADVLPLSTEQELNRQLQSLDDYTSVQMSVVTVASLGGLPARAYATRLMREWGIGQAGLNNGLLVLLAPAESEVYVSVGTGLEWQIPDAVAGRAVESMVSHFATGDFESGLRAGVDMLVERATSVPWDVRYTGLDALPERRTRAVGAVVEMRGQLSTDRNWLMTGGERVALRYPPYWEDGRRGEPSSVVGRIVIAEPLTVQVLGVIE